MLPSLPLFNLAIPVYFYSLDLNNTRTCSVKEMLECSNPALCKYNHSSNELF